MGIDNPTSPITQLGYMARDGKHQGELAELRFYLKAFQENFVVSKPFGENAKYDFVVGHENKLFRIQVKSTSNHYDNGRAYKINTKYGTYSVLSQKRYLSTQIDFIAAYIVPLDVWYLIPIDKIRTVAIYLFPHRYNKRAQYECYKERWDLLR